MFKIKTPALLGAGLPRGSALFLCFLCAAAFASCSASREPQSVSLVSYNVQTFFDAVADGKEYAEFSARSGVWNEQKYRARLKRLSQTLTSIPNGADIVLLHEIENAAVVRDIQNYLQKNAYPYAAFAPSDNLSISSAVLSRYPIAYIRAHQTANAVGGAEIARPMLEVKIETPEPLIVMSCHWKSKKTSAASSEDTNALIRRRQAAAAVRRSEEILRENPDAAIIIAGDLNESFTDGNALIYAASAPEKGGGKLFITDDKELCGANAEPLVFYEPWFSLPEPRGSYFYKGAWEALDHILCGSNLFNGKGIEFEEFSVIRSPLLCAEDGSPRRYTARTGYGYSDHLPVRLTLKLAR